MVELYDHQKEAINFLIKNNFQGYIALPPGLGKTRIVAFLIKEYQPRKALIVCPKSAFAIWEKELNLFEVPKKSYIVINYEKLLSGFKTGKQLPYIEFLVLDEAHRVKNIRAKTTRMLFAYAKYRFPKVLLSGTPFKELIDLYSQFFIINPAIFGRWRDFVEDYFERVINPFGGIDYIPKPEAKEEILKKIAPYFFRKDRSEITDLKQIEVMYEVRTPPQYSWKSFKEAVISSIKDKSDPESFFEDLVDSIKGKFIQFYREASIHNTKKHEFIKDFLKDNPDTVVFTYFVDEAILLGKETSAYVITGSTPFSKRVEILKKQDKPLIITSCFTESANLDRYGNLIFSTVPSSLIQFTQVAGRIDRLSQSRKFITYIYLLDEYNQKMLTLLRERKTLSDLFVEILRESSRREHQSKKDYSKKQKA